MVVIPFPKKDDHEFILHSNDPLLRVVLCPFCGNHPRIWSYKKNEYFIAKLRCASGEEPRVKVECSAASISRIRAVYAVVDSWNERKGV